MNCLQQLIMYIAELAHMFLLNITDLHIVLGELKIMVQRETQEFKR